MNQMVMIYDDDDFFEKETSILQYHQTPNSLGNTVSALQQQLQSQGSPMLPNNRIILKKQGSLASAHQFSMKPPGSSTSIEASEMFEKASSPEKDHHQLEARIKATNEQSQKQAYNSAHQVTHVPPHSANNQKISKKNFVPQLSEGKLLGLSSTPNAASTTGKFMSKGNFGFQKMGTNVKFISKKSINNLYPLNNFNSATVDSSPVLKSNTQNYQNLDGSKLQHQPVQNNLVYIPTSAQSPFNKQLQLTGTHSGGLTHSKPRVASAARASSSMGMSQSAVKNQRNLLPISLTSKSNTNNGGGSGGGKFREIKSRASRFNLSKEEQNIYHSFASILSTFDEQTMNDLVECLVKDAREQQANSISQNQVQLL